MRLLVSLGTLLALTSVPARAPGQAPETEAVRVIVNPATHVTSLGREEASRVFLKKMARWSDGLAVAPVDLAEDAPVRAAFTQAVHQRSVDMLTRYWQRQIFSGRQTPPPVRQSEAEVVAYVRSTPGAIGYVSADADVRGVRVVALRRD